MTHRTSEPSGFPTEETLLKAAGNEKRRTASKGPVIGRAQGASLPRNQVQGRCYNKQWRKPHAPQRGLYFLAEFL